MSSSHMKFREELKALLNVYSQENGSDTPDYILADYLQDCLIAFDKAVQARDRALQVDMVKHPANKSWSMPNL